ncbi:NTP transferase domain-containing protein [Bacillus sp. APMAM]|nr:NTP transferase domain-containing protein [Bacillus sp. APMAM]RTZ55022.1 CTP--phosphocholine cytidylyltransferase [Bacillus sp. SAJ1]
MNAIILAAGMGTRLKPLTNDTPKSLVKVGYEPMIERQIRFLKEKGINDIIIVTGYLHHKFEYLIEKFNVKLLYNDKYHLFNNIYSMYLVRNYLQDSYVIEADVFMTNNFFKTDLKFSSYFAGIKHNVKKDWIIKFDNNDRIQDIIIDDGSEYIIAGISYWTKRDGLFIKEKLEEVIEKGKYKNLYWDNIIQNHLESIDLKVTRINTSDWFEIDTMEDLESANNYLLIKSTD